MKSLRHFQVKDLIPLYGPLHYMDRNPCDEINSTGKLETVARGLFLTGINTAYLLAIYYPFSS